MEYAHCFRLLYNRVIRMNNYYHICVTVDESKHKIIFHKNEKKKKLTDNHCQNRKVILL